ncbi:tail fiber assembly protein [Xenorhabdus doucetiae]|uniref:tail fiber assembly protein n=1 Tax=Xenorhabdus doucetiae TaxID=351671 RepID=UPI0022B241F6|nr:tail fiber assembly protein [Xenorhabdus doucetiae]
MKYKYFLDPRGEVYGYPMDGSQDELIGNKKPISYEEMLKITNPPPTLEQLQQLAESQKRHRLKTAAEKIDICQDAVDLGIATNAEKSALTEWRRYRVLLNRVDCSTAPDIQWPEQPE